MKKKIQKPFDAEAAKKGAKVETREGRSVRILCYDKATAAYPIVGLVNYESVEHCYTYTIEGKVLISETSENDLVIIEEVEEAKFKVGEVIVDPDCVQPWFIIATSPDYYMLQDTQGNKTEMYQTIVNTYFRLWTLKDAKPGDVLILKKGKYPFIFQRSLGDAIFAYCGLSITDSIILDDGRPWTNDPVKPATYKERQHFFNRLEEDGDGRPWSHGTVRPATYEERQLFFNRLEEEGYKWDAESLTLSKKRWRDDESAKIDGYFINNDSRIIYHPGWNIFVNHNVFATEKQAKSALAMARISQIMAIDKRFGGIVTDKEWDSAIPYFVIAKVHNMLIITRSHRYEYLGFHTMEQANLFLEENEDLIKMYYMLD